MASDKGRSAENQGHRRLILPKPYVLLVLATGASIGAIAGLSKSPVAETVLGLVAVFVAGAGGLLLFPAAARTQSPTFLRPVGIAGLGFLAAFWAFFIGASSYRHHNGSIFDPVTKLFVGEPTDPILNEAVQMSERMRLIELSGHLAALGLPASKINQILQQLAATTTSPTEPLCAFDQIDINTARQILTTLARVYDSLVAPSCQSVTEDDRLAAKYLVSRVNRSHEALNNLSGVPDAAVRSQLIITNFILDIISVSGPHPVVRQPPSACLDDTTMTEAQYLSGVLFACNVSNVQSSLLTIRGLAAGFSSIWRVPSGNFTQPKTDDEGSPWLLIESGE